MAEESLEVGTVVKITEILADYLVTQVRLQVGMEGIVTFHNAVFKLDEDTPALEQEGPVSKDEEMYFFEIPNSHVRIGPIGRMPDDHRVIAWIVKGELWTVTNVSFLFKGDLKWFVVRTGEILHLTA